MTVDLKPTTDPCAFCTKGKVVFVVKSDVYTGRICAAHLSALLTQQEPELNRPSLPANGQTHG